MVAYPEDVVKRCVNCAALRVEVARRDAILDWILEQNIGRDTEWLRAEIRSRMKGEG